jgi:hypothetical protein
MILLLPYYYDIIILIIIMILLWYYYYDIIIMILLLWYYYNIIRPQWRGEVNNGEHPVTILWRTIRMYFNKLNRHKINPATFFVIYNWICISRTSAILWHNWIKHSIWDRIIYSLVAVWMLPTIKLSWVYTWPFLISIRIQDYCWRKGN